MNHRAGVQDVVLELQAVQSEIELLTIEGLLAQLPAYQRLGLAELEATAKANFEDAITVLEAGVVFPGMYSERARYIAESRLEAGIPIDDIMRGYRISMAEFMNRFMESALRLNVSRAAIVRGNQLMWQTADVYSTSLSRAYQEIQSQKEARDYAARYEFIVRTFENSLIDSELRTQLRRFGLAPNRSFVGFFARYVGQSKVQQPPIFQAEASGQRDFISSHYSQTVLWGVAHEGLVPSNGWQVVFGHSVAARDLSASLQLADQLWRRTLEDSPGASTAQSLSWRGMQPSDALIDYLTEKYITPLEQESESFQELLWNSVATFVSMDCDYSSAAAELFIHPNTLRYRTNRYQDLCNISLQSTTNIIEISVLAYERNLKE
ncbi:helix-turn-helix domain-containing protein [Pseudoglutamicibacter cumminsii]|uniref:helix-turn-helix domain-containing protein n=1 Tax=Pseudoglutamicibacter cumminsii TaxID=156979 RepID=UPI002553B1F9|nr:helix-turn-helix domain-containing protein [Pseudoglutamicibacter cumminsii]MDZ3744853.1 helix-turn-helix domain-containing protein [Pseudoglutamicibacter cumminsii]